MDRRRATTMANTMTTMADVMYATMRYACCRSSWFCRGEGGRGRKGNYG